MGSGGSSGGAGGSLGGGKTVLAGTFLAEQTHSSPASYTLVSVGAKSDRRSSLKAASGGNRGDRLRKARVEKGGLQCTKLAALQHIDSLLLPNEESAVPQKPKGAVGALPPAGGKSNEVPAAAAGKSNGDASNAPGGANAATQQRAVCEPLGPTSAELPAAATADSAEPAVVTEGEVCLQDIPPNLQNHELATPPAIPELKPAAPTGARPAAPNGSPRKLQLRAGAGQAPLWRPDATSEVATCLLRQQLQEQGQSSPASPPGTADTSKAGAARSSPSMPRTPSKRGRPRARPVSQPTSMASEGTEVFKRLYIAQKPWVAGRTDNQLLQYLAWRGGTPEIASPTRSFFGSSSLSSSQSPSRSHRRQYRNHRDLFDDCLHREASPSPPRHESSDGGAPRAGRKIDIRPGSKSGFSPQKLGSAQVSRQQNSKLFDQIEDITPIPNSAAEDWRLAHLLEVAFTTWSKVTKVARTCKDNTSPEAVKALYSLPTRSLQNNSAKAMGADTKAATKAPEACPSGCGFQITWHATHCCQCCADIRAHGKRCERKPMPKKQPEGETDVSPGDVSRATTVEKLPLQKRSEVAAEETPTAWDEGSAKTDAAKPMGPMKLDF